MRFALRRQAEAAQAMLQLRGRTWHFSSPCTRGGGCQGTPAAEPGLGEPLHRVRGVSPKNRYPQTPIAAPEAEDPRQPRTGPRGGPRSPPRPPPRGAASAPAARAWPLATAAGSGRTPRRWSAAERGSCAPHRRQLRPPVRAARGWDGAGVRGRGGTGQCGGGGGRGARCPFKAAKPRAHSRARPPPPRSPGARHRSGKRVASPRPPAALPAEGRGLETKE